MKSKQGFLESLLVGSTVGGVTAGTNLQNMSIYDVFYMLFNPYQPPSFTSFAITGQATTLEIGDSIAAGNKTFTWGTSNSSNVQANSINISDNSGTLLSSEANDGSATYSLGSNITNNTVGATRTFTISATNSNSNTFSSSFIVTWRANLYVGKNTGTTINEAAAEALTASLGGLPTGTKSFSAGPGYIYYVYPSSFANISTMKDQATNLDVPYTQLSNISITNGFGVTTTYKVFRTINQLNGAITLITT
ncbi:MAG: hypothetical protein EBU90_19770 [Proteobacteria bacterium]|nr:hypothetical protein [Pseudomonadota bacterium]